MLRRPAVVLALWLLFCPAASAAGPQATVSSLERHMRSVGGASGALVVDLDTGEELLSVRPGTRRVPASVQKLYTTSAALLDYGPSAQLTTTVLAEAPLLPDGVLEGDIYLKGGGDPTLGKPGLEALARQLAAAGLIEVQGRVVGDESYFDTRRGPPSSHFRTSAYVGPLSALALDHGRTGRPRPWWQARPAAFAATAFAKALRRQGINVRSRGRTGIAPAFAVEVGRYLSPKMAQIAKLTNAPSDNYMAETLIKGLGARFGEGGTTSGGAHVVRTAALQHFGVRPRVADGSGLSRSNRTSPREVMTLLRELYVHELEGAFRSSLAVAGRTGTLEDRMRKSAARGRCQGKTGTLISVSALAGYCETRGGATVAFAFLMNRVSPYRARTVQDRMLDAIARYAS